MRLFAQELVEQVIDCCTDPNAMKAWGLVCKRWLHRTRYHLFSKVSLSKENLPFFVDLVEASPLPILSFIRELTLCYNGFPPDAALLERLHACPNLESIWIETPLSVEDSQSVLDWLNSEESLRRHMRAWGISSSISSLILNVQGVSWIPLQTIVDIISCVPTIDDLVMCLHNQASIDADADEPSAFPLALKSLTLTGDGTDPFLSWLLSLPVSSRLNHLILDGIPGNFDSLTAYFQRAGHELDILRVVFLSAAADIVALMEQMFRYTIKLKYISFVCHEPSTALAIVRLLPSSGLNFVKITFRTNWGEEVPWQEFDATLAESRFTALKWVSINSYETHQSIITADTRVLMPLANARGILK